MSHPHVHDAGPMLVLHATRGYGVRPDQLQSDVTLIAFAGSHDCPIPPDQDPPGPRITYGFTGKDDPTRRQLTVSLSVTEDEAIPAWYHVVDGNAADCRSCPAHLATVREDLRLDQPLISGDSKLITRSNMLSLWPVNACFVGPVSLTEVDWVVLQAHWEHGVPMECLDPVEKGEEPKAGCSCSLEVAEVLADPEQ